MRFLVSLLLRLIEKVITPLGLQMVDVNEYTMAISRAREVSRLVEVSGHLWTVNGREPRVVKRLQRMSNATFLGLLDSTVVVEEYKARIRGL